MGLNYQFRYVARGRPRFARNSVRIPRESTAYISAFLIALDENHPAPAVADAAARPLTSCELSLSSDNQQRRVSVTKHRTRFITTLMECSDNTHGDFTCGIDNTQMLCTFGQSPLTGYWTDCSAMPIARRCLMLRYETSRISGFSL